MSKQLIVAIETEPNLSEAIRLLGPAFVLSTESARDFDLVFAKLLTCLKVRDELEVILVRDLAEASWEMHRYGRLRGLSLERSFKQILDFQVQRVKAQRARKQERIGTIAEHATMTPPDIAKATHLELEVLASDSDIKEILDRTPTELDHAHALEKRLSFHKDVEAVIASISRRRNEALHMLDLYRAGLGRRVDETMNEIIDAEVDEEPVQAPSVVPGSHPPVNPDKVKGE